MAWDGVSDFYEDDEPEEAIRAAQQLAEESGLVTTRPTQCPVCAGYFRLPGKLLVQDGDGVVCENGHRFADMAEEYISVWRRSDGVEEMRVALSREELAMPGYVEHVVAGYDGTDWAARVVRGSTEEAVE